MTVSIQSFSKPNGPNPLRQYLKSQLEQIHFVRNAVLDRSDFFRGLMLGRELKGSAPSYGFPKLARLGAEITSAATSRDPGAFEESLEKLRSYLSQQLSTFN